MNIKLVNGFFYDCNIYMRYVSELTYYHLHRPPIEIWNSNNTEKKNTNNEKISQTPYTSCIQHAIIFAVNASAVKISFSF